MRRQGRCRGGQNKDRHRFHFLKGTVFEGHTKLNAGYALGVIQCFAAQKNIEQTAMDTGLARNTVGPLSGRLRMAATLLSQRDREDIKFEHCEVEADETVVRKE